MADVISVMGRLLADQAMREQFREAPREVAKRLGLQGNDLELVCGLDPAQLESQAETLLLKRWHEITKLLPSTLAALEDGLSLFRFYASQSWPEGARRHRDDAVGFMEFLRHNQFAVDKAEWRLRPSSKVRG